MKKKPLVPDELIEGKRCSYVFQVKLFQQFQSLVRIIFLHSKTIVQSDNNNMKSTFSIWALQKWIISKECLSSFEGTEDVLQLSRTKCVLLIS